LQAAWAPSFYPGPQAVPAGPGGLERRIGIRGVFTFVLVGLQFLLADLLERTIVALLVRVRPAKREAILRWWVIFLRRMFYFVVTRIGGAHFQQPPRIPLRAGELIVMNHQSLLDIPVVYSMVPDGYPRIITNARYARGIPLVSHMLRFYDHRLVTPGARSADQFKALGEFGRDSKHPVVIFPEGHRTRSGNILRWSKGGLRAVLKSRKWRVHVVVVDGLWISMSIFQFIRNIPKVRCSVVESRCFDFDPETDDAEAVIVEMREEMMETLEKMRRKESAPREGEEMFSAQPDPAE